MKFDLKSNSWLPGLALVLAVFAVYTPVWWAGFVWDDDSVVWANPVIVGPLGLREIWTTNAADICPLTLTTFWFEHQMWGLNPLPYHLLNVLLHAANGILLWMVLKRLNVPGAWLGAALWSLHPVQVESVAWVAELKNTQSGLFFLLSVLFFIRSLQVKSAALKMWNRNYVFAVVFAALAMLSKSSTVVLPVILCLCAWWVERRLRWRHLAKLLPVFCLAAIAGLVTIWTQWLPLHEEPGSQWNESWNGKFAIAGDAIWFYLGKIIWPHPLITPYPHWTIRADDWFSFLPLGAALIAILVAWYYRRTWPFIFGASAWFLICLIPVLGLVANNYSFYSFVADHFQYLASMAPLALIGAGIDQSGALLGAKAPSMIGILLLMLLGFLTMSQARVYRDEVALWTNTLASDPNSWAAHNNLGVHLKDQGDLRGALDQYQKALVADPQSAKTHNNVGDILLREGKVADAISEFQTSIQLDPRLARTYTNLGVALMQAGKSRMAITQFEKGARIPSNDAEVYYNYGVALLQLNRVDEAIAEFQQALAINPGHFHAHDFLGVALAREGKLDAAIEQFQEAVRLEPDNAEAQSHLNKALAEAVSPQKK